MTYVWYSIKRGYGLTLNNTTNCRMHTKQRYTVQAEPPRRKVGMTRRSVSGIYLFRGRTPIAFESTLERDFLIRLEADRSVLEVVSQPLTLRYRVNGRERAYTPDYLVHYRQAYGGRNHLPSELIEVKPKEVLARKLVQWKPKFRAATRYCLDKGFVFRLMHEDRIRDHVWENMRFLARYRKIAVDKELSALMLDTVRSLGCMTFRQLVDACCFSKWGVHGKAHGIAVAWHLVVMGALECDLIEPLSNDTMIWVPDNER